MTRRGSENNHDVPIGDQDYEPPAVFDFGAVIDVTRGTNGNTHSDDNKQTYD
jgi:hypothetical protein